MKVKNGWVKALLVFMLCSLLWPGFAGAQILERPDNTALKPLTFGISSDPNDIVVSPADRYIVTNDTDQVVVIDTADWELFDPQPDPLDSRTESFDFLPNSVSLFVHQADAFITRILVDDPLNDLLNVDLSDTMPASVGDLLMDPESVDDHLFVLTYSDGVIYEYDISSQTIPGQVSVSQQNEGVGLNEMVYIALPANIIGNDGGEVDKMVITTDNGLLLFYSEELNLISTLPLDGTNYNETTEEGCPNNGTSADNILPAAALNTDRSLLYVLNSTDNVVHVVDTINEVELDTDPNQSGINPICLREGSGLADNDRDINSNIRDIVVTRVKIPDNAARGFITGDLGVTIINATEDDWGVIDWDEGTSDTDSMPLSATPNRITASSQDDGYIYTTNTNYSISVISEKPFITINSITPDPISQGNPSFTINFQVDELCDGCEYRIRANGDIDESGTLLATNTYSAADTANTDMDTPAIDTNSFPDGTFVEGSNRIFIFSDDADGLTGRDSIEVTVDFPPPDIEILSTAFGNTRGYITITRLTQEDIKQYNIYVLEALDQANPTCPGGLDFAALASPTASVPQQSDGSKVKITITNLANGVAYCIGMQAEDNAGNVSANIVVAVNPIIPEVTVGIAGLSGELGCNLNKNPDQNFRFASILLFVFLAFLYLWARFRGFRNRGKKLFIKFSIFVTFLSLAIPSAQALELTEQNWAAQFQGGFFLPTDSSMKQFLGLCCNGMYTFTFGRLWQNKYEVNLSVGIMYEGGDAVGVATGRVSGDRFGFTVVPISNSFVYRADYVENQIVVPYVSVGLDYLYFRESLQGDVTQGWKFGYHAAGGIQILLEFFDSMADAMEGYGINDVYLTLEGKWQQIDNFGGGGLAFTGFTMSAGLLFEF